MAHFDICRSGAFDKAFYLHNVSIGTRTCSLDGYSACGSGFSECALNERGIGFAGDSGRSRQAGGERGFVRVLVQVVGPLCI